MRFIELLLLIFKLIILGTYLCCCPYLGFSFNFFGRFLFGLIISDCSFNLLYGLDRWWISLTASFFLFDIIKVVIQGINRDLKSILSIQYMVQFLHDHLNHFIHFFQHPCLLSNIKFHCIHNFLNKHLFFLILQLHYIKLILELCLCQLSLC